MKQPTLEELCREYAHLIEESKRLQRENDQTERNLCEYFAKNIQLGVEAEELQIQEKDEKTERMIEQITNLNIT